MVVGLASSMQLLRELFGGGIVAEDSGDALVGLAMGVIGFFVVFLLCTISFTMRYEVLEKKFSEIQRHEGGVVSEITYEVDWIVRESELQAKVSRFYGPSIQTSADKTAVPVSTPEEK